MTVEYFRILVRPEVSSSRTKVLLTCQVALYRPEYSTTVGTTKHVKERKPAELCEAASSGWQSNTQTLGWILFVRAGEMAKPAS